MAPDTPGRSESCFPGRSRSRLEKQRKSRRACTRPSRWREWDGHLKTTRRPKECAFMKQRLLAGLSLVCGAAACGAADFAPPVRLQADGVAIRVEAPGYACPCWADIDGKGKNDLLVGQFR